MLINVLNFNLLLNVSFELLAISFLKRWLMGESQGAFCETVRWHRRVLGVNLHTQKPPSQDRLASLFRAISFLDLYTV